MENLATPPICFYFYFFFFANTTLSGKMNFFDKIKKNIHPAREPFRPSHPSNKFLVQRGKHFILLFFHYAPPSCAPQDLKWNSLAMWIQGDGSMHQIQVNKSFKIQYLLHVSPSLYPCIVITTKL